MKNVILAIVITVLAGGVMILGFLLWQSKKTTKPIINNDTNEFVSEHGKSRSNQNNVDNLSQEDAHVRNLRIRCENNGGKFTNIKCDTSGCDYTCVFSGGKVCGEFGWNKCVDSKGEWQPQNDVMPTEQDSATSDIPDGSKKFSDTAFGLGFVYPQKYSFSRENGLRRIYRSDDTLKVESLRIKDIKNDIREYGGNMGPQMLISKSKKPLIIAKDIETDGDGNKLVDKFINGIKYRKFKLTGMGEPWGYFVQKNGWYYTFEMAFAPEGEKDAQAFENIMKSVKFIK